jgi:hypothetical protein
MIQQMFEDIKAGTGNALRLSSLALAMSLALFISFSFLCAAVFVLVLERLGLIEALLSEAGIFLVVSLISAFVYRAHKRKAELISRQRQDEVRAAQAAEAAAASEAVKSTIQGVLTDPLVLAAGLQAARGIGAKRLIPLLALVGVGIGFFVATRSKGEPDT